MKELLENISKAAILKNEEIDRTIPFNEEWLGFDAATQESIEALEKKLDIKLPEDYITFLKTTNGFRKFCSVDSGFESVDKVDYLKNANKELLSSWLEFEAEMPLLLARLKSSIIIGGIKNSEQQFLLIPKGKHNEAWLYWQFSNWALGEIEYENLTNYFEESLKQIQTP